MHYCWLVCGSGQFFFFFFQAEDGIRDVAVTGVQTCALPILPSSFRITSLPGRVTGAVPIKSRTSLRAAPRSVKTLRPDRPQSGPRRPPPPPPRPAGNAPRRGGAAPPPPPPPPPGAGPGAARRRAD